MTDKDRRYLQTQMVMQIVRRTKITGMCAECGKPVAHWIDTGDARMVCDSPVCYRNWLLPGSRYSDDADEEAEVDL